MTILEMMCKRIARERGIFLRTPHSNLMRGELDRLQIQYAKTTNVEGILVQKEREFELFFLRTTPNGQDYKELFVTTRDGCVLDYLTAIQQYGNHNLPTVKSLVHWLEFALPIDGKAHGTKVDAQFTNPEYPAFLSICNAFFPLK